MSNKENYVNTQLALPFLETNRDLLKELFETLEHKFELKKQSKQQFIDLGSGDGRVIIYSALNYGITSVGVEINKSLVKESKENLRLAKKGIKGAKKNLRNVKIIQGDLFQQILENYDYVYIFSLPTMQKYLQHVFNTINSKTIIISHKYPLDQDFFQFLKLEYILKHEVENPEIFTYFYIGENR